MHTQNTLRARPRLGLAPQLIGLIVLVALVAGGLVGTVLTNTSRDALREETSHSNLAHADLAAKYASDYVRAVQANVRSFASRPSVVRAVLADTPEQVESELVLFLQIQPALDSVSIYNTEGMMRVSGVANAPSIGSSFTDREWFQQVMATGKPYLGVPVSSRATGRPIAPYMIPILDEQGKIRSILGTGISLATLSDAIVKIPIALDARASLVDFRNGGIILAHADAARILTPVSGKNEAVRRVMTGERGTVETLSSAGEPDLIAYNPVPDLPWGILVIQPSATALAPVETLTRQATLLIALSILLAASLGGMWTLQITRPLLRLRDASQQLAGGDLTRRVQFTQRNEIGDLGRAFDQMADALAEKEAQLRAYNKDLQQHALQLEAANKELEAFSYSVSHDLRAPLRAVDGFSRILLEEYAPQLAPEAQRYLLLVRDNTLQMGHLIDDLLTFSRLGRQSLNKQPVAPGGLVRGALAELRAEQEGRRVEISIGDLPTCQADPALLKLVWANLLSNALKFTRKREAAHIEIGCQTQDGEPVYFVKDNGVGFDMQYVHKLFGVFQRLHRPEEYEGTGVGLATVQRIIHRHGGRAWAEAEVDKGATFYFTLGGGNP